MTSAAVLLALLLMLTHRSLLAETIVGGGIVRRFDSGRTDHFKYNPLIRAPEDTAPHHPEKEGIQPIRSVYNGYHTFYNNEMNKSVNVASLKLRKGEISWPGKLIQAGRC